MKKKREEPEQIEFSFLGIFKQKCTNPGKESLKQFKEAIGFSKWVTVFIGSLIALIMAAIIIGGPKIDQTVYTAIAASLTTSTIGGIARFWFKSKNNRSP